MDGLLLDGLPGLPAARARHRRAASPGGARRDGCRQLADLVAGLEELPAEAVVKASGPVRLVPAEGGLLPHLTVLGNVVHGHLRTHKVTRRAAEDECRQAADCGLEDVLDRYPHEITPGRRRLAGCGPRPRGSTRSRRAGGCAGPADLGILLLFPYGPVGSALLLITTDPTRTTGFSDDD